MYGISSSTEYVHGELINRLEKFTVNLLDYCYPSVPGPTNKEQEQKENAVEEVTPQQLTSTFVLSSSFKFCLSFQDFIRFKYVVTFSTHDEGRNLM